MNVKFTILVILTIVLTTGCQNVSPETFMLTPITVTPTLTHYPTLTLILVPTSTPQPLVHQPKLISKGKLNCSSLGTFTKCVDDVLKIEFEYPTIWGGIEVVLRTGGYTGYAYDYYFGGKTIAETEPLVAGGRSVDFSEGRGGMSTDFAGFGDAGLQFKKEACDSKWQDTFPVCQKIAPNVTWMIQFPNAKYICESAPEFWFYTTPVFRIEVDLPDNPQINGFVFEAPLFSEKFNNEVKSELYPLLGLNSDMIPTKCDEINQQAFDSQLKIFIERITNKSADSETLRNLDELIHLATSIVFRQ